MLNVVLGSGGLLGGEFLRQLNAKDSLGLSHTDLDVTDVEALCAMFETHRPAVVWNCIAYNGVDAAESNESAAMALNAQFPEELAKLCKEFAATLVHFSSGYVFDGQTQIGYAEDAHPNPLSVYGRSKFAGEQAIAKDLPEHYVVRLNWLFGKAGSGINSKNSFPDMVLDLAKKSTDPLQMVSDEFATPTYAEDLVAACIKMVSESSTFGIYHFSNGGTASWYEFAVATLELNNLSTPIVPISGAALPRAAVRPANAILLSTKFPKQRDWREALAAYYTASI